jgi:hypothetical protein
MGTKRRVSGDAGAPRFAEPNLGGTGSWCHPPDVNGDGDVNILDFVAFQVAWQAKDQSADCDENGEFNVLDFVCFQQVFVGGCG